MAQISRSAASLRVIGDDLVPEEITKLLGCTPTQGYVKGQVIRGPTTGREYTKRFGMWLLKATDREPEDFDGQVLEILEKVTQDLNIWDGLRRRYQLDLFSGFFMNEGNEGTVISESVLKALGDRGIQLSLDIYGPQQGLTEQKVDTE